MVLEAAVVQLDGADALLSFTVRDSGIGIDPDVCERIFDPFVQADGSTTRRYGGTGLGLAISRQLAAMMGGEIGVTSERDVGSRFWFTARLGRSAHSGVRPAPVVLAGRRVLVVDDNLTNLEILQHQLAAGGMVSFGVCGATLALERLATEEQPFDIAILDVHMPEIDGLALAERIRSQRRFDRLKLVMLSSVGCDLPRDRLAQLDIGGWVTKPAGAAQLFSVLERSLGSTPVRAPPPAEVDRQFHGRILLAEDNDVNQLVARAVLESLGLEVDVAANGVEAVAASASKRYDLLLMDCQMPDMDGFAATAAIRSSEGRASRSVIVAVTAHAMDGDRERCLAAGMDDYLSKPFLREDLERLLLRWLPQAPAPAPSIGTETSTEDLTLAV